MALAESNGSSFVFVQNGTVANNLALSASWHILSFIHSSPSSSPGLISPTRACFHAMFCTRMWRVDEESFRMVRIRMTARRAGKFLDESSTFFIWF